MPALKLLAAIVLTLQYCDFAYAEAQGTNPPGSAIQADPGTDTGIAMQRGRRPSIRSEARDRRARKLRAKEEMKSRITRAVAEAVDTASLEIGFTIAERITEEIIIEIASRKADQISNEIRNRVFDRIFREK